MMHLLIWIVVYAVGYILAFCMLRIEQVADGEDYTKGDRVLCIVLSLLSFGLVLFLLISAWLKKINASGYWDQPVKKKDPLNDLE